VQAVITATNTIKKFISLIMAIKLILKQTRL
jgi:hypothetical protein